MSTSSSYQPSLSHSTVTAEWNSGTEASGLVVVTVQDDRGGPSDLSFYLTLGTPLARQLADALAEMGITVGAPSSTSVEPVS